MDVDEVIDALYALPPALFTAARDEAAARAKRAGDPAAGKRIAGLRRPTLAAWTSNTLVRAKPEEVEQFRQLGQALRVAHRTLDGEQLRALSHQQHVVVGALALEAQRLAEEAGTPVSDTVRREVGQMLYAALADPEAADAWASGRLSKAPAPVTEFPGIDPDAVPPAPPPAPAPVPQPEPPVPRPEPAGRRPDRRVEAARVAAQDAEWAATAREDELRVAEEARQRTVEAAAAADAELERAQAARDRAYAAVAEAEERHREAGRTAREARRAAKAAGRRLRALTGDAAGGTEGGGDGGDGEGG
ncbi:hypothetical protein [Streptomyces sp. ISL-94]|uniref:hypothetical protein n=1 Tax=Streptomyces sp. ISL-94 TaxID=2819190 RepID=UPI001BEC413E|nr:hypothetical protein [Streptomyces sp. ISL-94]MBT2480621.1 hypothetical protein [Streptomyces sp. ISL-94]